MSLTIQITFKNKKTIFYLFFYYLTINKKTRMSEDNKGKDNKGKGKDNKDNKNNDKKDDKKDIKKQKDKKDNKNNNKKSSEKKKPPAKLNKYIPSDRKSNQVDTNYNLRPKIKKKKKKGTKRKGLFKKKKSSKSGKVKRNTLQKSGLQRTRKKTPVTSFDKFWYPKDNLKRSRRKKKKIKDKQDDTNVVWIIRHLHRLDRDEPDSWKKHPRYNQNFLDTPLTEFGRKAGQKAGQEIVDSTPNPRKILYVYTSPFTRCIETSLEIAKSISNNTGKLVQLRIEYGLSESVAIHLEFLKVIDQSLFIDRVPLLDFKLSVTQIAKDYYPYIDTKYKSLYKKADVVLETVKDSAERIVKVMNYLTNNHKNMVICTHQVPVTIANMFLYNRPYPLVYLYKINPMNKDKKDNNPKRKNCSYGILAGFEKDADRWKYIYPPDNEYYQSIKL
jgi:broad specificity phosphatase PhoE